MKKIRIFLGGYVNYPNAQNINCDYIAKYLSKDKFEVHTMYSSKKAIDKKYYKTHDIHLHKLIHHRFIWYWSKWLTMRFGRYDMYYLPKMESVDRNFSNQFKNKKCFIASVEGVITDSSKNLREFVSYYMDNMTDFFSISNCIAESVEKYWGRMTQVLPLGVEGGGGKKQSRKEISNIIWVGNVKSNKRPHYFIRCAECFPEIMFTMVGDGDLLANIQEICTKQKLNNVKFTGRIPNQKVYDFMQDSDLLLMTSEYEGLPKVIQEAAQCGLPSIYINERYRVDFVEDHVNGFAVGNLEQMIEKIQYLLDNPEVHQAMSKAAYDIIQDYTWEKLIKSYEEYFNMQYEKSRKK